MPSMTTILVVDGDGVSRRFVELAFEKTGSFQVDSALDGAGALEILAHTQVSAIIAETELVDMNGLSLFQRLATESRLRNIPFLFLSSDARVATRLVAFGAGIDDFLTKPCDVNELVARVRSLIGRRERALEASRKRGHMLAGRFTALSFPDLVTIIEQARRSGILSMVGERSVGAVYFDTGRVVHAHFGNLVGHRAFQALMEEEDAQFELDQEPCLLPESARTMRSSVTALILDAARTIDAKNHAQSGNLGRSQAREPVRPADEAIASRAVLGTPALLSPGIAAQFGQGVADSFALGDLRLYTAADLARWTRAEGGRQRFHVHLVADPTEAVSSILALAGSPSERWVTSSLTPEAKALGLTFTFRRELLLDIVHLDIANPKSFQASLARAPSLLVIAPPGGDFLAIGTKARVELEQLIGQLGPTAVVGVGNQALEPSLRSLPRLRDRARLATAQGALGFGSCDLRSLLALGIRLCTAGGPGDPA